MIDLETDPATGLLFIGFALFIILGIVTLTGTWALVIWIVIGLVAAFVIYALGVRLARRARGEYRYSAPERE